MARASSLGTSLVFLKIPPCLNKSTMHSASLLFLYFMSLFFEKKGVRVDPGHKVALKKQTGNINYSNENAERSTLTFP